MNSLNHEQYQMMQDSYQKHISHAFQGNQKYHCFNHAKKKEGKEAHGEGDDCSGVQCSHKVAEFYCIQHDMFLCENCFNDHVKHRGAGSIKHILTKEFNMWNSMLLKVNDLKSKLNTNTAQYKNVIETLREYYSSENQNPAGIIFASSTGSYSAT